MCDLIKFLRRNSRTSHKFSTHVFVCDVRQFHWNSLGAYITIRTFRLLPTDSSLLVVNPVTRLVEIAVAAVEVGPFNRDVEFNAARAKFLYLPWLKNSCMEASWSCASAVSVQANSIVNAI